MVRHPFNVKRKSAMVRSVSITLLRAPDHPMAAPRPPRPHRQERERNRALKRQAETAHGDDDGPIRVFGASGLIMTRRHSPPLNGTLAKSASGALELVPIHLAQNLARSLEALKERGLTLLGLDGEASTTIESEGFATPTVLVLGAEGK